MAVMRNAKSARARELSDWEPRSLAEINQGRQEESWPYLPTARYAKYPRWHGVISIRWSLDVYIIGHAHLFLKNKGIGHEDWAVRDWFLIRSDRP